MAQRGHRSGRRPAQPPRSSELVAAARRAASVSIAAQTGRRKQHGQPPDSPSFMILRPVGTPNSRMLGPQSADGLSS